MTAGLLRDLAPDDVLSPYLLQHRDNPVDWWQWGSAAFAEARSRDVPVFVSIGYATCHWCHVMAAESFEDPAVGAYLNQHFVSIKVDREERPDVDAVYMAAATALTGQGGWPLSVWLDHEGRVFAAGTYYPPKPLYGRPSFQQMLMGVAQAWHERRDEVESAAAGIDAELRQRAARPISATSATDPHQVVGAAAGELADTFDRRFGGFGGAPKFPPTMTMEFLLRHSRLTGDRMSSDIARRTLEAMARGGIYDQLGGGFARYSVDERWQVPHFEKMLTDNALLLRVAARCALAEDDLAHRVMTETMTFLLRDLRTPEGGFATGLDADAAPPDDPGGHPHEGLSYVWTPDQLSATLGPDDGSWAAEVFGVTIGGTFEAGASTLTLARNPDDLQRFADVRERLLAARNRRPQPLRDDKVVASWNALTITALAHVGVAFDHPGALEAAVVAGQLLRDVHVQPGGRLLRVSRGGRAGAAPGMLEDYGNTIEAWVTLAAATADPTWLHLAIELAETMVARFATGPDSFADTPDDGEALVRRPQDPADNAIPSGTSAAITALLLLAAVTGRSDWRERAEATLTALADLQTTHPRFAGWSLSAVAAVAAGPVQVALVGDPEAADFADLRRAAFRQAPAGTAIVAVAADDAATTADSPIALAAGRHPIEGRAAAFVCEHFACRLPVTEVADLVGQLMGQPPAARP